MGRVWGGGDDVVHECIGSYRAEREERAIDCVEIRDAGVEQ